MEVEEIMKLGVTLEEMEKQVEKFAEAGPPNISPNIPTDDNFISIFDIIIYVGLIIITIVTIIIIIKFIKNRKLKKRQEKNQKNVKKSKK